MKQAQSARKSRARPQSRKQGRGNNTGNNRPENRVRGNPKQLLDKYKTQARDAKQSGDHVQAEYYNQFADHYQRVLNEMRLGVGGVFEEYRPQARRADVDDSDVDSYDDDDQQPDFGDANDDDNRRRRPSRSQREQQAERRDRHRRRPRDGDDDDSQSSDDQPRSRRGNSAADKADDDTATKAKPAEDRPRRGRKPAVETDPMPFEGAQPDFLAATPPVSPKPSEPVKRGRGRPRKQPVEAAPESDSSEDNAA